MSLVNDLMIEMDREDVTQGEANPDFASAMGTRRPPQRRVPSWALSLTALSATGLFVGVGLWHLGDAPESRDLPTVAARPRVSEAACPEPESIGGEAPAHLGSSDGNPVRALASPGSFMFPRALSGFGAAGSESDPAARSASLPTFDPTLIERPASVRNVEIQSREGFSRLRIDTDPEITHRFQHDDALRHVELVFERSQLSGALDSLELVGTPIRAFSTERHAEDLHLLLGLDPGTRVQSQSLETAQGKTLFIDFHRREPPTFETGASFHGPSTYPSDSFGPLSELSAPAPRVVSRPPEPQPSTVPPFHQYAELPDARMTVEIAPSNADVERQKREATREASRSVLETARHAKAEGEITAASRFYRKALELDSGNRDALIEWAELLSEHDRSDDAIELIRRARHRHPDDVQLTIVHAKLLEAARRVDEAIRLLDESQATLTQAPEVHALAAALLQRAGRHSQAIDRYEAIVRRYPGESSWWLGLGISLDATGRNEEALDIYRIAKQIGTLSHPSKRWVSARIETLETNGEG